MVYVSRTLGFCVSSWATLSSGASPPGMASPPPTPPVAVFANRSLGGVPARKIGTTMASATAVRPTRRPDAATCRVSGPWPVSSMACGRRMVTSRPHIRSRCRPSEDSSAR